MSILERINPCQIGYLTADELDWLHIRNKKDATPKNLTRLGVLRRDLPVKCLCGNNVPVTKLYANESESPCIIQMKLPHKYMSISTSYGDGEVGLHVKEYCYKHCKGNNCDLIKQTKK